SACLVFGVGFQKTSRRPIDHSNTAQKPAELSTKPATGAMAIALEISRIHWKPFKPALITLYHAPIRIAHIDIVPTTANHTLFGQAKCAGYSQAIALMTLGNRNGKNAYDSTPATAPSAKLAIR